MLLGGGGDFIGLAVLLMLPRVCSAPTALAIGNGRLCKVPLAGVFSRTAKSIYSEIKES